MTEQEAKEFRKKYKKERIKKFLADNLREIFGGEKDKK